MENNGIGLNQTQILSTQALSINVMRLIGFEALHGEAAMYIWFAETCVSACQVNTGLCQLSEISVWRNTPKQGRHFKCKFKCKKKFELILATS